MLHVKYLRIRSHKISSGYHQELIKFLHLFSWYSDTGNLDVIQKEMVNEQRQQMTSLGGKISGLPFFLFF